MRVLPALVVVLLLLLPGGAWAASVELAGDSLVFASVPGEKNNLTVSAEDDELRVVESGASGLRLGPGCEEDDDADSAAVCDGERVRRLIISTGEGPDVVRLGVDLPAEVDLGSGRDQLTAGGVSSFVTGGPGRDEIIGGAGDDTLVGGDGDDIVRGGRGADRLFGGKGADALAGEAGADELLGQDGDDLLSGGSGTALEGAAAPGAVDGGADRDRLSGGAGDDTIDAADQAPDEVACGSGNDTGRADAVDVRSPDCERLTLEAGGAEITQTMVPYPIVRIVGEVSGSRTRVRRLQASVPSGARVHVDCRGRGCPFRSRDYRVRREQTLTLTALERRYAPGSQIEIFVTAPERIGKYTRFIARRGRAPRRTDRCVMGERLRAVPCGAA